MRTVFAPLSFLASAGCSLIYNPSNIDKVNPDSQVPVDMEIIVDANPDDLVLTRVRPPVLFEGQGTGGSRQAVVVVQGENIVSGATIEIVQHEDGMPHPSITVDTANITIDGNHKFIAVPVTVAVDANDADIRLDVKVSQPSSSGTVTQTLTNDGDDMVPALTLRGLPAVEGAPLVVDTAAAPVLYSKIDATSLMVTGTGIVRARSVSSLAIAGDLALSANGQAPGPGGGRGGDGGTSGQPGMPGGGTCGGAGGASATVGNGGPGIAGTLATTVAGNTCTSTDIPIASIANNASSGGGGGGGGAIGAAGKDGGGGGGAIELTAGGTLSVGNVAANGGTTPAGGGAPGGAGSGGVILLRAWGTATVGMLSAVGGGGATNVGKVRFDNPMAAADVVAMPAELRGPMLVASTPLVVTTEKPALSIVGTPNADVRITVTGYSSSGAGAGAEQTRGPFNTVLNGQGANTFAFPDGDDQPGLFRGPNTICVEVQGAGQADEGRNCLMISYLLPAT